MSQPSPVAYSYLRFSTPDQMRGDSFRRQSDLAREYAQRHGLTLDDKLTFQDLGVSAYHGRNVETGHLGDFLEAVRTGTVAQGSYLLVESLDRLSRQAARKALRVLEEIVDSGVTLVTLTDGRAYTADNLNNDPMSLIMALLIFVRANEESAVKSRRVRAAWDTKRMEASQKPLTARCPAWLRLRDDRKGFELIPERAAIVRRVFDMTLEGSGQHLIADTLNREGVPTWGDNGRKPAKHWHRSYIAKILTSPTTYGTLTPRISEHVNGKRAYRLLEPVPDYYPGAVSQETFARVQSLRSETLNPQRGRHAAADIKHLLAGLAKCPLCGGTMTRVSKGSRAKAGRPYLVCQRAKAGAGCEYRAVPVEYVDKALGVFGDVIVGSSPASPSQDHLDSRYTELSAQIDKIDLAIERLLDALSDGKSEATTKRLAKLEAERDQLRAERHEVRELIDGSHHEFVGRRLGLLLDAMLAYAREGASAETVQHANARLRECLRAVVVDYARGFLVFDWKHGGTSEIEFALPQLDGKLAPLLSPSVGRSTGGAPTL